METALRRPPHTEAEDFDHERRLYDDTTTWLAEVLPGRMQTKFDYIFDGQELYAQDGGELGPIFDTAIADAERTAVYSPNLAFEVRRRHIEKSEYFDMLSMARGEGSNTMVVVSDFPPELLDAGDDVGGYNVRRRQTMLRIITRNTDGSLTISSQSLDGSERTALESIYKALGADAEPGELLGQRIRLDLPEPDHKILASQLTDVYDRSLAARYGGHWYAGCYLPEQTETANTYEFVRSQHILLEAFMRAARSEHGERERLLYDLAAEMQRRLENNEPERAELPSNSEHRIDQALSDMQAAGSQARSENKTFSGCGMSLGAKALAQENELSSLGFGNKTDKETKYSFDKYMHCVVCQAPPKGDEKKKMCGPCGICKTCDTQIRGKKK